MHTGEHCIMHTEEHLKMHTDGRYSAAAHRPNSLGQVRPARRHTRGDQVPDVVCDEVGGDLGVVGGKKWYIGCCSRLSTKRRGK